MLGDSSDLELKDDGKICVGLKYDSPTDKSTVSTGNLRVVLVIEIDCYFFFKDSWVNGYLVRATCSAWSQVFMHLIFV